MSSILLAKSFILDLTTWFLVIHIQREAGPVLG